MSNKNVIDILQDEFIPYAGEILTNNLPSVGDGLLPVNRKVIYAMYKNGITNDKSYIKMLRASAMAMTYYVYGDMPLTQAMKNMGNNCLNYLYLDPKGSFGDKNKKDGVGASPRYIECKLSKYSENMLYGIEKNIVKTKRNFDNTEDEPIVLPSVLPNVLLNTSQSIAVGESSKIPAHNLNEVCDSFINYIKTQDIKSSIKLLNGCDLSLGGNIVYDESEFNKIYTTGRGSFTLVGSYVYDKDENKVTITEIPYETYIETIEQKIRDNFDKGNFKEVVDIHDGSDKDGIKLDIYLKKNTDLNQFVAKLRKYTSFECKFPCNFTLLDLDGKTPVLMGLEDIITKWTRHRQICINNEFKFDLDKNLFELNKLNGLKVILNDLDEAIAIIRSSKNEKMVKQKLTERFNLNKEQLDYIAQIKLINMNDEWIVKKIKNISELEKLVEKLNKIIDNTTELNKIIIQQLEDGKKNYGKDRMTKVTYDEVEKISNDIFIEDYNCTVVVTDTYIKKNLRYLENQKVKDGESVRWVYPCKNTDSVMVFTSKNNMYTINVHELQETQPSALGQYIPSILGLDKDESIIFTLVVNESSKGNLVFFYSDSGKSAKVPLDKYRTNRKKITNVFSKTEVPIFVYYDNGNNSEETFYLLKSSIDKVLIINNNDLGVINSRTANGVYTIRAKNESFLETVKVLSQDDIVENVSLCYYFGKPNSIGKFLREEDKGIL